MIIGLARVAYFIAPALCLAVILIRTRRTLAWYCWGLAAAVTAFYWITLFSAQEDGALETSIIPISIWTPLLASTLIAGLTRDRWLNISENPVTSQLIVVAICLVPSAVSYLLFT